MSRSDVNTLQTVVERRVRAEEDLSRALAAAAAVVQRTKDELERAEEEAVLCEASLCRYDEQSGRAIDVGTTAAAIAGRAAYRERLVEALSAARRDAAAARERLKVAETEHAAAQRRLATAAAKRVAAEKLLVEARRDARRIEEERMEEEAADLRAARSIDKESSC